MLNVLVCAGTAIVVIRLVGSPDPSPHNPMPITPSSADGAREGSEPVPGLLAPAVAKEPVEQSLHEGSDQADIADIAVVATKPATRCIPCGARRAAKAQQVRATGGEELDEAVYDIGSEASSGGQLPALRGWSRRTRGRYVWTGPGTVSRLEGTFAVRDAGLYVGHMSPDLRYGSGRIDPVVSSLVRGAVPEGWRLVRADDAEIVVVSGDSREPGSAAAGSFEDVRLTLVAGVVGTIRWRSAVWSDGAREVVTTLRLAVPFVGPGS